jgi:hypothetical protein
MLQCQSTSILVTAAIALGLGLVTGSYLFFWLAVPQLARLELSTSLSWFDIGWSGFAPTRSYRSFDYPAPVLEVLRQDARCDDGYVFFAPHGPGVDVPGGVIMDSDGELVWRKTTGLDKATQDFHVQEFQGEKYLTYWDGSEIDGRKQGSWFMVRPETRGSACRHTSC